MKKLEDILEWFKRDVIELFGSELVSIVLYGSAATQEYVHKKSDINFIVILTDEGIADAWKAQKSIVKWQKKRIPCPLFMTQDYMDSSLDSFPIEFLNIRFAYHVLFGENILKNVKIRNQDLRLECERELKGKLLQLRQGVVLTRGNKMELKRLIVRSLATFTSIFRALLYLKNNEIPKKKMDVLTAVCEHFELDIHLFKKLYAIRGGKTKLKGSNWIILLKQYITEIEKLSTKVDQMVVKN